jgi:hypothetical protein
MMPGCRYLKFQQQISGEEKQRNTRNKRNTRKSFGVVDALTSPNKLPCLPSIPYVPLFLFSLDLSLALQIQDTT